MDAALRRAFPERRYGRPLPIGLPFPRDDPLLGRDDFVYFPNRGYGPLLKVNITLPSGLEVRLCFVSLCCVWVAA